MLRKQCLISSVLCLLIGITALAQPPESFFPHHVGDMWEYYVIGDNLFDTLQVIVVSDSVGQDSFRYFQHQRQFLKPVQPSPITWWENFRRDTLNQVFTGLLHFYDRLQYKLNAPNGKLWIVKDLGGGANDIAKVKNIYPDTIFGVSTTVKEVWYYFAEDTTDSTGWLWQYTELLADGFGTIFRGRGDLALFYELFLKGAVIDGIVYGDTTLVGIEHPPAGILPNQFQLFQNYPNPFNPGTTIRFILNHSNRVSLTVYDLSGKEVIKLIDAQFLSTGEYEIEWNGRNQKGGDVASGMYFYQLKAGNRRLNRQMLKTQ